MLTKKQQILLQFISERLNSDGVPPSFDEMKAALDLKSKSGIHRLIMALEERGFIRRLPNRARAIEVIKVPETWGNVGSEESRSVTSSVPSNDNFVPAPQMDGGFSLPVMGKIAAGVPIAAIQDNTHSVTVPSDMIGSGDHFALTVEGDSMIEAGIHDGDTVVIQHASTATAGDIVVALVDDEEATLKTFRREGSVIALEAANPAYETRRLSADRVKVQGKMVGLLRLYN